MRDIHKVLAGLSRSEFRRRIKLDQKDLDYLQTCGIAKTRQHAVEFIEKRLAPAVPARDGRQTPWRGHPVFVAQHATASCCRRCLEKWHGIPRGRALTLEEKEYVVEVIATWLSGFAGTETRNPAARTLFD